MENFERSPGASGITIRPYRDADLEPVVNLYTTSIHQLGAQEYDAEQRAAWAPQPPDLERWQRRMRGLQTFVAEGEQVAGFISFESNGHISLLYTSPCYSRRGVASALYRCVESQLKTRGVIKLFTEASAVARPFFESHGFRVVRQQTVVRRNVALVRFEMEKYI